MCFLYNSSLNSYNKNVKNKLKKFFNIFFRIDIFNRLFVFLSMILFLILPSYVLYCIKDYNNYISVVLPCVVLLAIILGNGLFALYKPTKIPIFYFLSLIVVYLIYNKQFINISVISLPINLLAIYIIELCYCLLGFLSNIYLIYKHTLKKNNKYFFKDFANSDSIYDFLNARPTNEKIENKIEDISKTGDLKWHLMPIFKRIKLSKLMRGISFIAVLISSVYYLINIAANENIFDSPLTSIIIINLLLSSFLICFTIIYPKDFKYVFFYNICVLELAGILCCKYSDLNPMMMIICLTWSVLSLLVALITEGRTWMGATPDDF